MLLFITSVLLVAAKAAKADNEHVLKKNWIFLKAYYKLCSSMIKWISINF